MFVSCEIAFSFCCPHVNICSTQETELSCSENISGNIPQGWPLDINVPCIYISHRIFDHVRFADLSLSIIASVLLIIGLFWCFVRHGNQLGYEDVAKFSFHSCLNEHFHSFPSLFTWLKHKHYRTSDQDTSQQTEGSRRNANTSNNPSEGSCCKKVRQKYTYVKYYLRTPRIKNDLDFLVMMLFRSDTTHGKMFKSIQVTIQFINFNIVVLQIISLCFIFRSARI